MIPCYGMAEATLFISGKRDGTAVRLTRIAGQAPRWSRRGRAERRGRRGGHVDSSAAGSSPSDHDVRHRRPRDRAYPVADGRVGEVWVAGPNVAAGYLHRPEAVRRDLRRPRGRRADGPATCALATSASCSTASCSSPVAARTSSSSAGRNLYPQDIEAPSASNGCADVWSVAFAVADDARGEALVVVAELLGASRDRSPTSTRIRADVVVRGQRRARRGAGRRATSARPARSARPPAARCSATPPARPTGGATCRHSCRPRTGEARAAACAVTEPGRPTTCRAQPYRPMRGATMTSTLRHHLARRLPGRETSRRRRADRRCHDSDVLARRLAYLTVGVPTLGFVAAVAGLLHHGFTWLDAGLLAGMYLLTALGVEGGLHRFFSHRAFRARPAVTAFWGVRGQHGRPGAGAVLGRPPTASTTLHTDATATRTRPARSGDDRCARLRGLWHGHVGWLFTVRRGNWAS